MLDLFNTGTPLPPTPPRVPVEALYIKQAIGFALWNSQRGLHAEVHLINMERDGFPEGVIRFLGGTAVPYPHSTLSPALQSLQRMQSYFGPEVTITAESGRDFVPLHILLNAKVRMYDNPNKLGSAAISQNAQVDKGILSHEAADIEVHGLLPTSSAFIQKFQHKLERITLKNGKVQTQSGRAFNNIGIACILRHMLDQVQSEADTPMAQLTEVNPWWDNGDYMPYRDI